METARGEHRCAEPLAMKKGYPLSVTLGHDKLSAVAGFYPRPNFDSAKCVGKNKITIFSPNA
jgi:hypothetical protein